MVEITPDQEYLIAMEFFENSVEIGEAEIDGFAAAAEEFLATV